MILKHFESFAIVSSVMSGSNDIRVCHYDYLQVAKGIKLRKLSFQNHLIPGCSP